MRILNKGSIAATDTGITITAGTNHAITNAGAIQSDGVGLSLSDSTSLAFTNSGLLQGQSSAITASGSSTVTVKNTGTIDGDIKLGSGPNLITNQGSILGDVSLGDGGGTFNGRLGSVTGTIFGGKGADKIHLGTDGETVFGGAGHDTLFGGAGDDTFAFTSYQAADTEIIHSFSVVHDTIQLDHTVFKALAADKTPVFAIGAAPANASDKLFYNSATGVLSYDPDGTGTAFAPHAFATLDTGLALTANNFTVV